MNDTISGTPTREIVVMLAGGHTITMPVKDEVNDIESHVHETLKGSFETGVPTLVQFGRYVLRADLISCWYFRKYAADQSSRLHKLHAEVLQKMIDGDIA